MSDDLQALSEQVLAVSAVRDLATQALEQLRALDPEAAVPQLLDARRALRQAIGAIDTYEERIVETHRSGR